MAYSRVFGSFPPDPRSSDSEQPAEAPAERDQSAAAKKPATLEQHVRDTVVRLAHKNGDWVGLADLRPALGNVDQDKVTEVLKQMSREGKANLVPESAQRLLQQKDHDSAVRIGGEPNHLVSIKAGADPAVVNRVYDDAASVSDNDLKAVVDTPDVGREALEKARAELRRRGK
ncbi:MAG TPA: hypothetical protein VG674_09560 [Amycolatopsis sp.]|nr:hypothetical protein [Amycolatopsis sp.]